MAYCYLLYMITNEPNIRRYDTWFNQNLETYPNSKFIFDVKTPQKRGIKLGRYAS